ncbi:OLC1v1000913C1 [Oldenlandia corymbosa var. corymbosa]|uniref:OLC1v1000913C1 n=1 Tax=Oldenlandia corymbosa var. corymbosa TaxID=529605 RepID=A0AAV1D530_OLDCO|nr:OLC1v1000913C1 [Oldenlandia corymbosa var. corymbosa]
MLKNKLDLTEQSIPPVFDVYFDYDEWGNLAVVKVAIEDVFSAYKLLRRPILDAYLVEWTEDSIDKIGYVKDKEQTEYLSVAMDGKSFGAARYVGFGFGQKFEGKRNLCTDVDVDKIEGQILQADCGNDFSFLHDATPPVLVQMAFDIDSFKYNQTPYLNMLSLSCSTSGFAATDLLPKPVHDSELNDFLRYTWDDLESFLFDFGHSVWLLLKLPKMCYAMVSFCDWYMIQGRHFWNAFDGDPFDWETFPLKFEAELFLRWGVVSHFVVAAASYLLSALDVHQGEPPYNHVSLFSRRALAAYFYIIRACTSTS